MVKLWNCKFVFATGASGSNSLQTISSISRAVEEAVYFKMQFRSFWNQRILDLSLQCELRNYFWLLYPQPIKEHCLHTRLAGKRNRPRTEAMEYWLRSNILKWERPMWVCVCVCGEPMHSNMRTNEIGDLVHLEDKRAMGDWTKTKWYRKIRPPPCGITAYTAFECRMDRRFSTNNQFLTSHTSHTNKTVLR